MLHFLEFSILWNSIDWIELNFSNVVQWGANRCVAVTPEQEGISHIVFYFTVPAVSGFAGDLTTPVALYNTSVVRLLATANSQEMLRCC